MMGIPLDPGKGGRSIDGRTLEVADIIVSTTNESISRAIRWSTNSQVSHAMVYIGGDQVVEAIGKGVSLRQLLTAISDASLAVAYRYKSFKKWQALIVRDFVGYQLGKKFNFMGIVGQAGFQIDKMACIDADIECINRAGQMNMAISSKDKFFCSQLVLAAFEHAGIKLTDTPPLWNSPDDIAGLRSTNKLSYVGHLRAG